MAEPLLSVTDLWLIVLVGVAVLLAVGAVSLVLEVLRAPMVDEHGRVLVHACPRDGERRTPCCGRPPLELPRHEQITAYGPLVTCGGVR